MMDEYRNKMLSIEDRLMGQINMNDRKNDKNIQDVNNRINRCFVVMEELGGKQNEHERKIQ